MYRLAPLCLLLLAFGCQRLASADERARLALEELSARGFAIAVAPDAVLEIPPGRLRSMGVSALRQREGRIEAVGRLSLEGRLGGAPVSFLGDERFTAVCNGPCRVEGEVAPRLSQLLATLLQRREALAAGDAEALAGLASGEATFELKEAGEIRPSAERAAGWFIRIDRDRAIVGEAIEGGGQERLVLQRGDEGWRVTGGLL